MNTNLREWVNLNLATKNTKNHKNWLFSELRLTIEKKSDSLWEYLNKIRGCLPPATPEEGRGTFEEELCVTKTMQNKLLDVHDISPFISLPSDSLRGSSSVAGGKLSIAGSCPPQIRQCRAEGVLGCK
jgi:hypothetical protein